jgi:hypothetical protein
MSLQSNKFWAVDDASGGNGTTDLDAPKPDTYDLLAEEDAPEIIDLEEKPDAKEKKASPEIPTEEGETEETSEEEDELTELERELEEPDEEKLELVTPVRRKEILAKYPKLFKDFPYLEKAYYRDQQFTEIYPSIDDARTANEKASTFDEFSTQLMQGHSEDVLKSIKKEDEGSWNQLVDNYMVALWNTDQTAYNHVIANINKTLIASMVQEGKKLQNDALISAAAILNQFIFGTAEWSAPTRLSKEERSPQNTELERREYEFNKRQFTTARDDLQTRVTNSLRATIDQNIDKTESMTEYVKKAACGDAMQTLERLISQDTGFQRLKDKLWQRAYQEGYSKPSMDKIRSAIVTKAKTLLPTVIKKARNEALKGLGKRRTDDTEDRNDGSTRPPKDRKTTSSSRSDSGNYKEKAKKIPKGMSTLEFFNSD